MTSKLTLEKFIKNAEKWGIKYEINSDNPGLFVRDAAGNRKEITLEELFFIDDIERDLDEEISIALKPKYAETNKIHLDKKYSIFTEYTFGEVA